MPRTSLMVFPVVFRLETELEKAQQTALSLEERMRQAERERIEMEEAQRRAEEARRQAEAAAHLEKAEREAKVRDIIIRTSPSLKSNLCIFNAWTEQVCMYVCVLLPWRLVWVARVL